MKRICVLTFVLLTLILMGCNQSPTDAIAGNDVQYSGKVTKAGGADYSKWTYRIVYSGHGYAYYPPTVTHLTNDGGFSVFTPYGPEELHNFQVYAVGDVLVCDIQNPNWQYVAKHQYTFNFILP